MKRVSVLMPVHNGEKFIADAIQSILNQTYSDFDFIIVDDYSTDNTRDIISSFQDQRISFVENQGKQGIVGALNCGLDLIHTEYIVRMDADDLSLPQRIRTLVDFMDTHPSCGVCGSWVEAVPAKILYRYPLLPDIIRSWLLFFNPFVHPAVIMRTSVFKEHDLRYRDRYLHSEDYDLWVRLQHKTEMWNLREVLLLYRQHPDQIGNASKGPQMQAAFQVLVANMTDFLGPLSDHEKSILFRMISGGKFQRSEVQALNVFFTRILETNSLKRIYADDALTFAATHIKKCLIETIPSTTTEATHDILAQ